MKRSRVAFGFFLCWCLTMSPSGSQSVLAEANPDTGKRVYDFYCYQCHGYAGRGDTLAAAYLDPPPRNFSATSPGLLSRQRMIDSVSLGRAGTAMISFAGTLNRPEIEAVVDYVRASFMAGANPDYRYHTYENGWPNHQRYAAAFPFVSGELLIDMDETTLSAENIAGKRLFLSACISCHEPAASKIRGVNWELDSVSYPPGNYEEREGQPSPYVYELHEERPVLVAPTPEETWGQSLYLEHCAHCHAEDGSGRNWIGRFLMPHPPNFNDPGYRQNTGMAQLYEVISEGVVDTSMPAWKSVLAITEIGALVKYLNKTFGPFVIEENAARIPERELSVTELKWDPGLAVEAD